MNVLPLCNVAQRRYEEQIVDLARSSSASFVAAMTCNRRSHLSLSLISVDFQPRCFLGQARFSGFSLTRCDTLALGCLQRINTAVGTCRHLQGEDDTAKRQRPAACTAWNPGSFHASASRSSQVESAPRCRTFIASLTGAFNTTVPLLEVGQISRSTCYETELQAPLWRSMPHCCLHLSLAREVLPNSTQAP